MSKDCSESSTPQDDANPHGCRHPSWKRSEKPGKVACELCGAVGDELRYIKLDDPQLDLRDTFTRMFVLAEYWQHEALSARRKLEALSLQSESTSTAEYQRGLEDAAKLCEGNGGVWPLDVDRYRDSEWGPRYAKCIRDLNPEPQRGG